MPPLAPWRSRRRCSISPERAGRRPGCPRLCWLSWTPSGRRPVAVAGLAAAGWSFARFSTAGRGAPGPWSILAPLGPLPGEVVVVKNLPNSFAGTALDEELKRLERKELIVVGFMTHMCVSATVRAALDHGYRCTVVAAACATRDLPDGRGGVVRVELAALGDRFAVVVPTAAAIRE
ncbi:MAG: isochorismatase family protein [Opitutaceae bacterium]|nr:isochorismatase family protein [Opitutaceae bacterium]